MKQDHDDSDAEATRRKVRTSVVAGLALALVVVVALTIFVLRVGRDKAASAERYAYAPASSGELPKLWQAPAFSFVDQHGSEVTLASLRGRPWIADFIFTECTSACPMMTAHMVMLQRKLAGDDLRFVSFSVDPEHDSPAALEAYAKVWNSAEPRWTLLSTNRKHLQEALDGFRVTAAKSDDPANPIIHSSLFLLVDAEGWVRGAYDSNDPAAQARLATDVRKLDTRVPPAEASGSASSGDLYASLGCAGCHSNARIAPALTNLRGAERMLDDGTKITIDDAYLKRSVVEPGAQRVAGYPTLMPSYAGQLSDAQVSRLVQELAAMKSDVAAAPPSGDAGVVQVVVDPVCHMSVRAEPATLHVTHEGHDVYFCSTTCRDAYVANPSKFADTKTPRSM